MPFSYITPSGKLPVPRAPGLARIASQYGAPARRRTRGKPPRIQEGQQDGFRRPSGHPERPERRRSSVGALPLPFPAI